MGLLLLFLLSDLVGEREREIEREREVERRRLSREGEGSERPRPRPRPRARGREGADRLRFAYARTKRVQKMAEWLEILRETHLVLLDILLVVIDKHIFIVGDLVSLARSCCLRRFLKEPNSDEPS